MSTKTRHRFGGLSLIIALMSLVFAGSNTPSHAAQESTATGAATSPADQTLRFADIQFFNRLDGWATAFVADTTLFLRTQDGGETWRNETPTDFNSDSTIANWSSDFLDMSYGWLAYIDNDHALVNIWRTENGGQSWAKTTLHVPYMNEQILEFIDPTHGWLLLLDCCAAGNEFAQLYQTEDGGLSWRSIAGSADGSDNSGLPTHYHTGFVFQNTQEGWLTLTGFGGGGGVSQTLNGGQSWRDLDLPARADQHTPGGKLFCAVSSPTVFGPGNLTVIANCPSVDSPDDAGMIYVYHTGDDGKTWRIAPMTAKVVMPLPDLELAPTPQIDMLSPTDGWMLAVDASTAKETLLSKDTLYQTLDGGQTWTKLESLPVFLVPPQTDGFTFPYIEFLDLQTALAIDPSGQLQITSNAGKTWSLLNAQITPTF